MQVRNVVDEIENTVGSNVFGPIEAKLHAIATQLDLRKPTESGAAGGADVGLARINVVGGAVVAITGRIRSVAGPPGAPLAVGKNPGKFPRGVQVVLSPASCALSGARFGPAATQAPIRPSPESSAPGPVVTGTKWGAGLPLVYCCCS